MSREFGQYSGGCYFHDHIRYAFEDAESGSEDITKLVAALLKPLVEVSYAVSSLEASDSGKLFPVQEVIKALPDLEAAVRALQYYVRDYQDHAEEEAYRHLPV